MKYTFDANAARKADIGDSRMIREIGAYTGILTRAEDITSRDKGTRGIELAFTGDDNRIANMTIWTMRANGEFLGGFNVVQAMMCCMRQRELAEPKIARVKKYDWDARQNIDVDVPCYVDLMRKPIGLMLFTEDYLNGNGEKRTRMAVGGVFEARTKLVASEIVDCKTAPEMYDLMLKRLKHRPLRERDAAGAGHSAGSTGRPLTQTSQVPPSSVPDFDDDIPF